MQRKQRDITPIMWYDYLRPVTRTGRALRMTVRVFDWLLDAAVMVLALTVFVVFLAEMGVI